MSIDTLQTNIHYICVETVAMGGGGGGEQHNLVDVVFLLPPELCYSYSFGIIPQILYMYSILGIGVCKIYHIHVHTTLLGDLLVGVISVTLLEDQHNTIYIL